MVIHCPNYTHIISNESPGLIFAELVFGTQQYGYERHFIYWTAANPRLNLTQVEVKGNCS